MENIIIRDLNKVYGYIKIFAKSSTNSLPYLLRIILLLMFSAITIRAFNIKETVILNGWINIQLILGIFIWQLVLWGYMKLCEFEEKQKP